MLYLGLGMLAWRESADDDQPAVSPLLLLPVTVARDSLRESFRLRRTEDDPVVNPALAVKLEGDFDLTLPDVGSFEENGLDGFLREVEELVQGREGWSVTRRTVLSTFTFQKEGMYRDLLDNEEELAANPMIQVLALGTEAPSAGSFDFEPVAEDRLEEAAPPEDLVSIRDADATQRRCVLAARDGHSFVMDGPPGSGKSQTITNIIAELMHAGKSVLFVSEKAAALEVVHNRLKDAHLDEFALQLHSHNATRKAVAAELGHSLRSRPTANGAFTAQQRTDLERRRKALSSYAQAMNEVRHPLGRSLHQALGTVATLQSSPQAPVPNGFGRSLRAEELSAVRHTADTLGRAWDPVLRGDGFLWRDLRDATLSASRKSEVERDLAAAESALDSLHYLVLSIEEELGLGWDSGPADGRRLLDLLVLLNERMTVPSAWLSADTLDTPRQRSAELSEATRHFRTEDTELRERAGAGADDLQVRDAPDHNAAIAALRQARQPLDPDGDTTADTLRAMVRFLRDSSDRLDTIAGDAGHVAAGFGLAEDSFSIDRAAELADLGALVDTPTRPESQWLNPAVHPALKEAHRVLGELHREFLERRDDLRDVFTDDVLELDLRSLRARFAEVHRGLGKLRSAYREDKRTLAPYTVSGKVDRRVRERLGDAAAWQELADRLTTAESHHVETLGTHYYQRGSADFDRIATAIQVARDAVRLAGGGPREEFTRQLARGESPDPDLVLVARRLGPAVTSWLDEARQLLGPAADRLRTMPIAVLRSWCETAAERLEVLGGTVEHVSGAVGAPATLAFSRDALERASNVERLRASAEGTFSDDMSLFGDRFDGVRTDWAAVDHALAWAERVRTALGGPVGPRSAEALVATATSPDALRQCLTAWEKASARITEQFTESRAEAVAAELDGAFNGIRDLLRALRETVGDIEVWASYAQATAWLANQGLEPVVSFCAEQRVAAEDVRPVIERAVLEAWADDVLRSDAERLGALRATDRDALVAEFRELDRQQVDSAAARVINACTARRPTTAAGVAGVIQREAEKKRRHMPVRELMGKSSGVAQTLKPCFMMSPLLVSQYLPPTMRFDVVIFDEASQVRPSDAVNCVYRGNQLIVAGDQQQLPPTSFFAAIGEAGDDTYDEEQIDEFESVLDLCKAGALRSLPLLWHYRSRHESLITYSNYNFYDGRLLTFPGATAEGSDVGVELIKVDGVYRRGSTRDNAVEARKVIERVLHHRRHHPDLTLGVVTFSSSQEDAIERELELRSAEYPELAGLRTEDRIGGFFVKNLENVQGDERDVIIFSVGYGPDEHGKFTLQIPHLSRSKSERRLNVAITRAKSRVEMVTSVHAGDFPNTMGSNGLRHLKGYLDFAERGTSALAAATVEHGNEPESPFEEEVLGALRSWGYDAEPQVGVAGYRIDIGVPHPERPGTFALGVECDGAMYHSSKVARDRDRLRQSVLEGLGWNIHRIWGTAWYRDRAGQEARLRAAVEEAVAGTFDERAATAPAAEPAVVVQREEADLDGEPQWTEPYRAAHIDGVDTGFGMHQPEAQDLLRKLIAWAVQMEGPVHEERVLRAVRTAWGVGRAGSQIQRAFNQAVRDLVHGGHLEREEPGFLGVPSTALNTVRVPTDNPNSQREANHVPPRELRLAISRIVREAHAITPEEVSVRVARLFGWKRRGHDVRAALDEATKTLTDSGELVLDGGHLKPAAN